MLQLCLGFHQNHNERFDPRRPRYFAATINMQFGRAGWQHISLEGWHISGGGVAH